MRIAVWGAGEVGMAVTYRLATTPATSSLVWINRTSLKIKERAVDLEHGLAFAPSCHEVLPVPQEQASLFLRDVDLLVVTLGHAVEKGHGRASVYRANREMLMDTVVPVLKRGFPGVVLVVTNPVDLMARLVYTETGLPWNRVIGLGTVVETARLRHSLGSYLIPPRPAREVWAYAIGTHDSDFVPVVDRGGYGLGARMEEDELEDIVEAARNEVARAAARVKMDNRSTLHPIAEGVAAVAEAIALDTRAVLTVSVLEPRKRGSLFFSVPCTVGREGVLARHADVLADPAVEKRIERCRAGLRSVLRPPRPSRRGARLVGRQGR